MLEKISEAVLHTVSYIINNLIEVLSNFKSSFRRRPEARKLALLLLCRVNNLGGCRLLMVFPDLLL